MIRDGRHTSASLVARKVWWPYAPHQWVAAHRTALADLGALPQHRVTLLRYEEMVEDPELVLRSVCERTGLTWNAAGRDAVMQAARSQLRDVEDRWRRLPGYQRRYVLRVIGDLQSELGYPVTE